MPTYEYQCDACEHLFEEFQSFSEDPLTKCPQCKKKKLRRLLGSGAAFIFKGSGFYETDYRSESYKAAAKADQAAAKPAEAKSDTTGTPAKTDTPGGTAGEKSGGGGAKKPKPKG